MPTATPPAGDTRSSDRGRAPRHQWRRLGILAATTVIASLTLSGCAENHSLFRPHGPDAGRITALLWFMLIVSTVVTIFVFTLMVVGLYRRGERHDHSVSSRRLVIGGGVILPAVVVLTLAVLTVFTLRRSQAEAGRITIDVTGHQFWWEVRYPGTSAVTANEIHIPVGQDVEFNLRSVDVIHSFWVPSLAQKVDMIPGITNHLVLRATRAGTYRGQCAEFCGIQHANMVFQVVAEPPDVFEQWLRHQGEPAAASPQTAAGERTFETQACAGCHTVRGTTAHGTKGPDLTHVAERTHLGAGIIPNHPAELRRWINDAPSIKPGVLMPQIPLSPHDLDAITSYVGSLQ